MASKPLRLPRRWLPLTGVMLALGCATGPQVPKEPMVPNQVYQQRLTQLPSGLRVMVQEAHNAPLVAIAVVVGAGSADDPAGQEGLAHLVEHLAYRAVGDRLKRAGASFNATTEPDRTTYFELAHRDRLEELMAIEGARLAAPLAEVTPELFDVERDVVRNEQREREHDPRIMSHLFQRAFPNGHALARSLAPGPPLGQTSLGSATAFVGRHYRPDNITIVVAGDVQPEAVLRLVETWSAALIDAPTQGPPPRPLPTPQAQAPKAVAPTPPPPPTDTTMARLKMPVPDRSILVAWPAPADARAGDPFLLVSQSALTIQLGVQSWTRSVRPILISSKHGSLFFVEIPLDDDDEPEKVREDVLDSVVHARGSSVAREYTNVLTGFAATSLMRGSSNLLSTALSVSKYLAATGQASYYRDTLSQLGSVDAIEVSRFVYATVNRERAVTLLVEPETPGGDPTDAAGPVKHELAGADATSLVGMGRDEILQMVRGPRLGTLPRFRLDNGLETVLVPLAKDTAVAAVAIQLPLGNVHIAPYGAASFAFNYSRTDCEYEDGLRDVGGRVMIEVSDLAPRIAVQVFSGNVANALAAANNRVRCRRLRWDAVERLRHESDAAIKAREKNAKKPAVIARAEFWAHLYPDRAFGPSDRDRAALRALNEEEFERVLSAQFQPDKTLAVVATDLPPADARQLVAAHLGLWREPPAAASGLVTVAAPSQPGRRITVVQAERPQQASVRIACRLRPVTEASLPAHEVLESIVEREANQVRASWGATYGFHVNMMYSPRGIAHLEVAGALDPKRAADAVARVFKFFAQLASAGPDIRSFMLKRWDLGRAFNLRFAAPESAADALLDAHAQGFTPAVWDEYPTRLADLSRTAIRELLEPCAGRESVVVIGDKPTLERDLRGLGILQ